MYKVLFGSLLRSPTDYLITQRRCLNLIMRCELLIDGLRDGSGEVPENHRAALDEAEGSVSCIRASSLYLKPALRPCRILNSIRSRVLPWTRLNTTRSLLMQDDIREGLDEFDKKINTCIATYHVPLSFICFVVVSVILHICLADQDQPAACWGHRRLYRCDTAGYTRHSKNGT